MDNQLTPISLQDSFRFSCSPDVPCFNECCRDLNQFLTPYDILRLKNHLGLSSGDFLTQYTYQHTGPESGLPIITLRPKDNHDRLCPFVSPRGCRVYENRPSSCRTYPLVRALSRSRQSGEITEQFMVLREPHCLGFSEGAKQTVYRWMDGQKIAIYNEINDKLMQIISLKNQLMPGALDLKSRHFFYTALYDLDNFRSQIQKNGLPDNLQVDSMTMDKAMEDDLTLLELGMKWIKKVLFNQI
ncbi:MAG: YkgJ family cysteine cluster protein [Desulfobacterales bacterium]